MNTRTLTTANASQPWNILFTLTKSLRKFNGMVIPNEIRYAPPPTIDITNPHIKRWDNGLILQEDFITPEEEAYAISAIEADTRWTGIGKRQTLQFGHHFDYTTFGASETDNTPLPPYLADLVSRLPLFTENMLLDDGRTGKHAFTPDQFTVQYYPPGTGIPPHVDTHSAFREALYSLSLGSAVQMAFKKCGKTEARRIRKPKRSLIQDSSGEATPLITQTGACAPSTSPRGISIDGNEADPNGLRVTELTSRLDNETKKMETQDWNELEEEEPWELLLPPRSLLIMTGPSRYGYTHKIRGRKSDRRKDGSVVERKGRYSITMRK